MVWKVIKQGAVLRSIDVDKHYVRERTLNTKTKDNNM